MLSSTAGLSLVLYRRLNEKYNDKRADHIPRRQFFSFQEAFKNEEVDNSTDMMDLRPLGGGGEGFPSEFLAGVCCSVLQSLTLCQTEIRNFHAGALILLTIFSSDRLFRIQNFCSCTIPYPKVHQVK